MSKIPRRVKINWPDLELAMDQFPGELHAYLDVDTGNVMTVSEEVMGYLEDPPDDLPEWQQEELEVPGTPLSSSPRRRPRSRSTWVRAARVGFASLAHTVANDGFEITFDGH